ncbi:hypothetical protein pb186bvf_015032 [Paramecium bursaria]
MRKILLSLFLSTILEIIFAQTSTNICSNDPLVYKLDLRQYIKQLGISDIQSQALCDLVQRYDYVWLTQIWTPSQFNYQSFIDPTQAQDYRILTNVKEYSLDPVLGTTQDLRQLKTNLNQFCYNTKFLGEFSFYLGKDSSLLQNQTRFLRIPDNQITRTYTYNPRYDEDGFIWAVDDFGRTIPNSAVWNLFSQTVITDIKDIIYRQILTQYNLDGIVFLQPSLGLYSSNQNFYQAEVSYFGQSAYLKDFYVNFGLQNSIQTYFFMGGEDNSNCYQILLIQVYSQFTLLKLNQKSCFRVKFNTLSWTVIGLGIQSTIASNGYVTNFEQFGSGIFGLRDWMVINTVEASLDQKSLAFNYSDGDTIEVQYDPINQTAVFRKYQTNLKYQMFISAQPSTLQYLVTIGQASYQILYPFWFSNTLRTTSATLTDSRNFVGTITQAQQSLQFGQILPNLNLFDTTTLNIQIKKLPAGRTVAVGICNQNGNVNEGTLNPSQSGSGAYMMISNGSNFLNNYLVTFHDDASLNHNQTSFIYNEGNIISVTYTPGQNTMNYTLSVLNVQRLQVPSLNFIQRFDVYLQFIDQYINKIILFHFIIYMINKD